MYTCTCKKSRQYGLSLIHSGLSAQSAMPPVEGGRIGRTLYWHHRGLASSWPCSLSNSLGLSHSPPFLPPLTKVCVGPGSCQGAESPLWNWVGPCASRILQHKEELYFQNPRFISTCRTATSCTCPGKSFASTTSWKLCSAKPFKVSLNIKGRLTKTSNSLCIGVT